MGDKRIITCALTGNWGQKHNNPNIPLSPKEIHESAEAAIAEGASVLHIHARNDEGMPTCDPARFAEIVNPIREKHPDIIINMTSSGEHSFTDIAPDDKRIAPFYHVKSELGTYDCGTLNWMHKTIFENNPQFLEKLGTAYNELGVKPEIEIFDMGMIDTAKHYLKTGILKAPAHFAFILGAASGMPATPENLCYLVRQLPEGSTFSANGMGAAHVPIIMTSLALGGHVRVGIEDNIYFKKGQVAESNAQFVKQAADLIKAAGLEVATPAEAREILSISKFENKQWD